MTSMASQALAYPTAAETGASCTARRCILSGHPEYQRSARRKLSRAFSSQAVQGYEPLFLQHADLLVDRLRDAAGPKVDLQFFLNSFVWDCMAKLFFDEDLRQLEDLRPHPWTQTPIALVKRSALAIVLLPPSLQVWCRGIFPRLSERLAPPRCMTDSHDHLQNMLGAGKCDVPFWKHIFRDGEQNLTPEEIKTNVFIFAIAGGELTSAALCGLFVLLIANPAKMSMVCNEILSSFTNNSTISLACASALPYLDACVEEALRLYPPSPTGLERLTPPQGIAIGGYAVSGGVRVSVAPVAANKSPANFTNPEAFVPERWLKADSRYAGDDQAASQPFSVGPNACIGRSIAIAQLKVATVKLLYNFDITRCGDVQHWLRQKAYIIWDREHVYLDATVKQARSPDT
ncbi:hypothetical protein LTR56_013590 [Elasticomyces elasticus]|nr:hypothetical protein LTR56_013590 [Elasticomyces elasticus]KAK3651054.1 hypothetical protein LTR22_012302 [Elasticomyces elasticus]KAK4931132.1 hypothetical protein LTR49_002548 [Elasticomyces elasticus]KAK5765600.1 hypothetical protein LTS12_004352 [Elasticomyces elasticus]